MTKRVCQISGSTGDMVYEPKSDSPTQVSGPREDEKEIPNFLLSSIKTKHK